MSRRGMVELLQFLDRRRRKPIAVVFDDLKLFARDTIFHLKLRQELALRNATVECPNFKFEETPEGMFVETVIAAHGELERHQIRRQTLQKMKARVEQGYYLFKVPLGYRYERVAGRGRMLVKNEPLASIIKEAIEGYAVGRFELQAEVGRFLQSCPAFPRTSKGLVRQQLVHDILTRVAYAGCVEAPNWGVSLRKGHHEPLLSLETFRRVQERLHGQPARMPTRKDASEDFPLRGLIVCADCGAPLTACWSTGRWKTRYPYYLCVKRGCASYGKSIRRTKIQEQFEQLISKAEPCEGLIPRSRSGGRRRSNSDPSDTPHELRSARVRIPTDARISDPRATFKAGAGTTVTTARGEIQRSHRIRAEGSA
jgi:site-specific DNA recombinase